MVDTDVVTTDEQLASFTAPDQTLGFAEKSHLTYIIPSETRIDLDAAFRHIKPDTSVVDSIEQRESLFFGTLCAATSTCPPLCQSDANIYPQDETVDVLLILKTPLLEESILRSHIARLSLSVEAQVVNSSASSRDESPGVNDVIFSGAPEDINSPFIFGADHHGSGDAEGTSNCSYCVWKVPVLLARPRMRLQGPSIVFTASAYLKPDVSAELNSGRGGYLQSGMPSGYNLLESFSNDPALNGVQPRLSALRVSRVAPVTKQQELLQHIRALQQLTLRIHPVIHTRVRFARPNTVPPSSAVVAMLEVDFTPHFDCEVILDSINLTIADSDIKDLNTDAALTLPLNCVSHDHVTFLYHITPNKAELTAKNAVRELSISITATAEVVPGHCTPPLSMTWSTNLDFTTPVNPGFSSSSTTGIQRAHRPSQLSIGSQAVTPLKSPGAIRPDALPTLEASTARADTVVQDLGITMSFTGPKEPVHPGEIFCWTIYVVNRATEKTALPPRKLALVAIPKRRRNEVRPIRPPSTATRRRGEQEIADAVQDEAVLHAFQKNAVVDSTDVVCLSADTRVGPLAPGACHVVELQFLTLLQEGIVGIEAIRVVDLGSQEHVDIRDLPVTIVKPISA